MSIKKYLNDYIFFIIILFITILPNIYLLTLPLIREFSYEFAVVNSLIFFLFIPLIVFYYNKKRVKNTLKILHISFLILSPLFVAAILQIFQSYCSFWDGIFYYVIITVVSGILAFLLSEIIFSLSSKLFYLLYLLAISILILIPLLELYFNPQIYFYSPIIGYFPGTIYDEEITIDHKLIFYRLLNLVILFFLFILIKKEYVKNKYILLIILIALPLLSFFLSPLLGFSTNERRLNNFLSSSIERENVILRYEQLDSNFINLISLNYNFYFEQLSKKLGIKPSKKLTLYLFSSSEDKRKYFGSENADVSKPWLYHIYTDLRSWKLTLKHELAHCFSAESGSSLLKLSGDFNPFLIEGFATSQDPFYDYYDIDYLVSIHLKTNKKNLVTSLIDNFNFFNFNSTISYIYAGSFCKYLIEEYGIEKFKEYYKTNDFFTVYRKELNEVLTDYENYIIQNYYDVNTNTLNYFFGRKPLIQKDCPRYLSKEIKKGWKNFYNGNYENAKIIFNNVLEKSNNHSALSGLVESLIKLDSIKSAEEILISKLNDYSQTPYEYFLKLKLADLYAINNNIESSLNIYKKLENENPTFLIKALSNFRIKLCDSFLIKDYLIGNDSLKLIVIKKLNEEHYVYSSFPVLVNIAENLNLDYKVFLDFFNKSFTNFDEYSSFGFLKLSEYIVNNMDFERARKISSLAKRTCNDNVLKKYIDYYYKKIDWFFINSKKIF